MDPLGMGNRRDLLGGLRAGVDGNLRHRVRRLVEEGSTEIDDWNGAGAFQGQVET